MDTFKKKLTQKERQINYYYSNKGQETYRDYYNKNKSKISAYAKEYRKEKVKSKLQQATEDKKKLPIFEIKRGSFILYFD